MVFTCASHCAMASFLFYLTNSFYDFFNAPLHPHTLPLSRLSLEIILFYLALYRPFCLYMRCNPHSLPASQRTPSGSGRTRISLNSLDARDNRLKRSQSTPLLVLASCTIVSQLTWGPRRKWIANLAPGLVGLFPLENSLIL